MNEANISLMLQSIVTSALAEKICRFGQAP
jgi:hypothetical protein